MKVRVPRSRYELSVSMNTTTFEKSNDNDRGRVDETVEFELILHAVFILMCPTQMCLVHIMTNTTMLH